MPQPHSEKSQTPGVQSASSTNFSALGAQSLSASLFILVLRTLHSLSSLSPRMFVFSLSTWHAACKSEVCQQFKIRDKAVPRLQQFLFLSWPSPNTTATVPFSICSKTWKGHSPYPQRITPTSALGFISHSPHLAPQRPPFIDYAPPAAAFLLLL